MQFLFIAPERFRVSGFRTRLRLLPLLRTLVSSRVNAKIPAADGVMNQRVVIKIQ